jgi:hypothetical protein
LGTDVSFGLSEVLVGFEVEEGIDASGGGRVFCMEFFDGGLGVFEVGLRLPGVLFVSKAFPLDEVLKFFVSISRIENFYFVLFELSDDFGQGRVGFLLYVRRRLSVACEEMVMEDGVDLPLGWQVEFVGASVVLLDDLEGSVTLRVEFLRGSGGVDILSRQPDLCSVREL